MLQHCYNVTHERRTYSNEENFDCFSSDHAVLLGSRAGRQFRNNGVPTENPYIPARGWPLEVV